MQPPDDVRVGRPERERDDGDRVLRQQIDLLREVVVAERRLTDRQTALRGPPL